MNYTKLQLEKGQEKELLQIWGKFQEYASYLPQFIARKECFFHQNLIYSQIVTAYLKLLEFRKKSTTQNAVIYQASKCEDLNSRCLFEIEKETWVQIWI